MICIGKRKGEALGLQRTDIDFEHRMLFVHRTLVSVDNSHTEFSDPRTPYSRSWIALPGARSTHYTGNETVSGVSNLRPAKYEDTGLISADPTGSLYGRSTYSTTTAN